MVKLSQVIQYIQSLSKKDFQKHLIAVLSVVAILALAMTYYVYHRASSLTQEIKKLNAQTNKISQLISKNEQLIREEQKIQDLLEASPDFNMNTYFEKFYTKHKIKPEPNWKPEEEAVIESSQPDIKYQEVVLKATFKNQTMQKLVTILQDIYNEQIIYLKGLVVTAEKSKINFELTLATKLYKKEAPAE